LRGTTIVYTTIVYTSNVYTIVISTKHFC